MFEKSQDNDKINKRPNSFPQMKCARLIDLKVGRKLQVSMFAGLQRLYISRVLI